MLELQMDGDSDVVGEETQRQAGFQMAAAQVASMKVGDTVSLYLRGEGWPLLASRVVFARRTEYGAVLYDGRRNAIDRALFPPDVEFVFGRGRHDCVR